MSSTSRLASAPHRPLTGPPGSPMAGTPADTPLPGATADRAPRAVAARRALLVACPLLAGAFAVVAAVADPASGLSGRSMTELYIAHPDPLQWKSTGYHWAYAFWIAPALLLAGLVRGLVETAARERPQLGAADARREPAQEHLGLRGDAHDHGIGRHALSSRQGTHGP